MLRFKMLAKDIDANPIQYRTWVVPNSPDFSAQYYTGPKSGKNPFVDVSCYVITDDNIVADFNLPLGDQWHPQVTELPPDFPIEQVLPAAIEDSQLAVIDGYIYMFGGKITDSIYRASVDNPATWIDTGAKLPTPLYGSSLAIINDTIYLFGGCDGYLGVNTIFSASVSNPLSWIDTGHHLPHTIYYSSLGMYEGELFLFGGLIKNTPASNILRSHISNPLQWTDTGYNIPAPTYGSVLTQINGVWQLYGGLLSSSEPTNVILGALSADPYYWYFDGYLPYATAHGQFFTIGNDGYLVAPMSNVNPPILELNPTGFTPIIQCHLDYPSAFIDGYKIVRGVISHSQLAILSDRVWLFGGSGSTSIFTCNQNPKYNLNNATAMAYGRITRTLMPTINNINNPYQAIGIPYWRTDYNF